MSMHALVARLYFERDLTKQEIAHRLGLSRFKVARLLDQAREQGIVRVEIRDPASPVDTLGRALEERFSLRAAVVVPDEPAVPAAAARLLAGLVSEREVLGVAWGATVAATVELLPALATGTAVVQICGAVPGLEPGTGPTEVALRLAERTGGAAHPLPAPALASRAARDELLANPAIRPTVELFTRVTLALVGVGPHPAGGHVLVHAFDRDGRLVETEMAERAISLPLVQPRSARVLAVAAGEAKRDAVRGALHAGLVDLLVTDVGCAEAALA
jgi:DNA-binding transcriptional regulator LsrR (DeoR family)